MNSSVKNAIFLIKSPLSSRDYERFGIDEWLMRGWNVIVFDFTKILDKKRWDYVRGDQLSIDYRDLIFISSKNDAINRIESIIGYNIFIDLIGDSYFEIKCRNLAKKRGRLLKLQLTKIPSLKRPVKKKLQSIISKPTKLIKFIWFRALSLITRVHADYYIVAGLKSEDPALSMKAKTIRAHNLDYDFLVKDKNYQDLENSHILFLDEEACYHPDYASSSYPPCATPNNYFSTMNKGLSWISAVFAAKVIIAAHPRSDYSNKLISFEHPIVKGNTYELIKNSKLVVAHGSTAIQWAILFRKPILLVTTDELENSHCSTTIGAFRSELHKSVVNLDSFKDADDLLTDSIVDDAVYDRYIENYIKQDKTPFKLSWSIVIDALEEDINNDSTWFMNVS